MRMMSGEPEKTFLPHGTQNVNATRQNSATAAQGVHVLIPIPVEKRESPTSTLSYVW